MSQSISAFVVSGTHSGVGKTTVTLGILAALRQRGLRVQAFKAGPDFIDPGLHARVAGESSYNLDGWMLSREANTRSFAAHCGGKDAGVVEGVMGLFDGYDGKSDSGSTAELARWLDLPVILVVDASAMARSAAALVLGYLRFDPGVRLMGVIFNRIAGDSHMAYLREAMASLPEVECFGGLQRADDLTIPERHLGLLTAEDEVLDQAFIGRLGEWIERGVDLDRLIARSRTTLRQWEPASGHTRRTEPRVSIGVARDKAFSFYYPDNLEQLESAGAHLIPFSPLSDSSIPVGAKALYFGGGYPEIHAGELARNDAMRRSVREFVEDGGVAYAECGGFMYLCESLTNGEGTAFPMAGVYPFNTRMLTRLRALGYREIEAGEGSFLPRGLRARGHEFHYSELDEDPAAQSGIRRVYAVSHKATIEREGFLYKNCLASYIHLHFGSNPAIAESLVGHCR